MIGEEVRANNRNFLGVILFCVYVLSSYIAQDVILPALVNSICLYLFVGCGIICCLLSRKIKINKMIIWMLCFLVYGMVTLLYSPSKSITSGQYYYSLICFVIILFLSQVEINKKTLYIISWTYSLSAPLLTVLLILTGNITDTTGRLGNEVFGNANTLAMLLMVAAMNSLFLIVYNDKIGGKIVLLAGVVLDYYAMFLSGGRKFVVVPVVFLYILLLCKTYGKKRKRLLQYTILIAIIVFVLYQIIMKVPLFYEVIGVRMEGLFSFFSNTHKLDASAEVRRLLINKGMERWFSSPIWGYGFDSFKYYNRSTLGGFYYSHNNYVELLHNMGLIGFVVYYYFYYWIIKNALKNKQMPVYARALSVSTIVSLLVFEYGAVDYSSVPIMIMLFIAFTVQKAKDEQELETGSYYE